MKHLKPQKNQQSLLKIRHFSLFVTLVFSLSLLFPAAHIFAALSCTVATQASCNSSGFTTLLRLSGATTPPTALTNAHAELPSQSTSTYANNVVCCNGGASAIGNSCVATNKQIFARLSAVTNAHVQETSVNTYGTNACLSDTSPGDVITVGYQNTNCTGYDTTLFSISASNNATSGDGSAYTRKVCATITPQILTFDLDTYNTSTTTTNTIPAYSVALGVLTTGSVNGTTEAGGVTPNGIWFDLDTNAVGGAVVSVQSANSSLKSTSTPAHTIPSSSGLISAGTPQYGICANRNATTSGTLNKLSPYNVGTCGTTPSSNTVGLVDGNARAIYDTNGGSVVGARGEIMVDATIGISTPAHTDYTDTLTFIVTGTF